MRSLLTDLQLRIAEEFFAREQRFVLTGGGALAGFLLGHRTTSDLDLFVHAPLVESGDRVLREVASALGASIEAKISAPDFKRYLLSTASDSCVVDLVHDRAPTGDAPKVRFGAIVVDPPEEILANKLVTLLSRNELRDLVDVLALERAGYPIEGAVPLAARKDGGLTPAQLGWVLSQITIGDDAAVPGGVSAAELRRFLLELQHRLGRMAWPS